MIPAQLVIFPIYQTKCIAACLAEIESNWSMELPVISSVLHRLTLDVTAPMEITRKFSLIYDTRN